MKKRTRTITAIAVSAVVVSVAVIAFVRVTRDDAVDPVQQEIIAAQKCYHDKEPTITSYLGTLARESRTTATALSLRRSLGDLASRVNIGPGDPVGAFGDGMTGDQFCAQVRELFLKANEAWRTMPPPLPDPSPTPTPSPASDKEASE